jgi:hypothetical protein
MHLPYHRATFGHSRHKQAFPWEPLMLTKWILWKLGNYAGVFQDSTHMLDRSTSYTLLLHCKVWVWHLGYGICCSSVSFVPCGHSS